MANRLGIENEKYDFYLGGTDSCQGERSVALSVRPYLRISEIVDVRRVPKLFQEIPTETISGMFYCLFGEKKKKCRSSQDVVNLRQNAI